MTTLSCAFVGHYPIRFRFGYDEEDWRCQRLKLEIIRQIMILYQNGVTDFYTNCEIGPPMWGAEAVLALMDKLKSLRLYCVIPYEEQATKWTPDLRDRYFTILEKCTAVHTIENHLTKESYRLSGKYMVDHTNFVLAVYDNQVTSLLEPVSFTIQDAKAMHRGIIYIHPDTAQVTPIRIEV